MSLSPQERRLWIGAGVLIGLLAGGAIVYELSGTMIAEGKMPVQVLVQAPPGVTVQRVQYIGLGQLPEGMTEEQIGSLNSLEWDLREGDRSGPNLFHVYAWHSYRASPWRIAADRQTWETYLVIAVELVDGKRFVRVVRTPHPAHPPYIITFPIPAAA